MDPQIENQLEELKKLVGDGKLKAAIELLGQIAAQSKHKNLQKEVLHIRSRYTKYKKIELLGTANIQDLDVQRNKLLAAIIDATFQLEETISTPSSSSSIGKYIAAFFGIVLIAFCIHSFFFQEAQITSSPLAQEIDSLSNTLERDTLIPSQDNEIKKPPVQTTVSPNSEVSTATTTTLDTPNIAIAKDTLAQAQIAPKPKTSKFTVILCQKVFLKTALYLDWTLEEVLALELEVHDIQTLPCYKERTATGKALILKDNVRKTKTEGMIPKYKLQGSIQLIYQSENGKKQVETISIDAQDTVEIHLLEREGKALKEKLIKAIQKLNISNHEI